MTGAVAYQMLGMDSPLWIALAMLGAMLVFALRSRRLRLSVQDTATALNEP